MNCIRFFFPVLSLALIFQLSSCVISGLGPGVDGEGELEKTSRNIDGYTGVATSGIINLRVKQGAFEPVVIESEANLHDLIKTEIENGVLKVTTKEKIGRTKGITVWVTAPQYNVLSVSGAGDIDSENTLQSNGSLSITISGAGDMNCMVDVDRLETRISGAGDANLSGRSGSLKAGISGSGSINAYDLEANDVELSISGAGAAKVYASDNLSASISGAGSVRYKGNPTVQKSISGAGSIRSAE